MAKTSMGNRFPIPFGTKLVLARGMWESGDNKSDFKRIFKTDLLWWIMTAEHRFPERKIYQRCLGSGNRPYLLNVKVLEGMVKKWQGESLGLYLDEVLGTVDTVPEPRIRQKPGIRKN